MMKKVIFSIILIISVFSMQGQTVTTDIVFDPIEGLYNIKRVQIERSGDTSAYQILLPVWQDSTTFAATLFQVVTETNRTIKALNQQITEQTAIRNQYRTMYQSLKGSAYNTDFDTRIKTALNGTYLLTRRTKTKSGVTVATFVLSLADGAVSQIDGPRTGTVQVVDEQSFNLQNFFTAPNNNLEFKIGRSGLFQAFLNRTEFRLERK